QVGKRAAAKPFLKRQEMTVKMTRRQIMRQEGMVPQENMGSGMKSKEMTTQTTLK
ncbi:hypothetical protein V3C99_018217, partial [Haemonchus contortus]